MTIVESNKPKDPNPTVIHPNSTISQSNSKSKPIITYPPPPFLRCQGHGLAHVLRVARSSAAATDQPHSGGGGSGISGSSSGGFIGSGIGGVGMAGSANGGIGMAGGGGSMLSVRSWGALVALSHAEEQLALAFALSPSTTATATSSSSFDGGGGGGGGDGGGDVEASQRRWLREWTRLCCLGDLHGKVMQLQVLDELS